MKLTTLDLKKQQFGKTFRGFDPEEVRSFLDLMAQQWDEMQDEVRRAEERVAAAEHKLKHYERVEMALQEALEAAREGARRSEATAEQRAKMIVEEAELKALRVVNDAEQERHHLRQDLVKLTHRQNEVAARMRSFLMSELEILAQFQGDDPVGFIKLMPAGAAGELAQQAPRQVTGGEPGDRPAEAPASAEPASAPPPLDQAGPPAIDDAPADVPAPPPPMGAPEPAPAWIEDELAPDVVDDDVPPGTFAEDAGLDTTTSPNGVAPPDLAPPSPAAPSSGTPDSGGGPEPAAEVPPASGDAPARSLHETLAERLRGGAAGTRPSIWHRLADRDDEPDTPAGGAGEGWSLRSLVTGEPEPDAPAEVPSDEQEKIRRLLEDLD